MRVSREEHKLQEIFCWSLDKVATFEIWNILRHVSSLGHFKKLLHVQICMYLCPKNGTVYYDSENLFGIPLVL